MTKSRKNCEISFLNNLKSKRSLQTGEMMVSFCPNAENPNRLKPLRSHNSTPSVAVHSRIRRTPARFPRCRSATLGYILIAFIFELSNTLSINVQLIPTRGTVHKSSPTWSVHDGTDRNQVPFRSKANYEGLDLSLRSPVQLLQSCHGRQGNPPW
jgi:hypothetical protein